MFRGYCDDIPRLHVPGFIKFQSSKNWISNNYPDISSCKNLALTVKSNTKYAGFRVSFGSQKADCGHFFAWGHKAQFDAPTDDFKRIEIPFTSFSDCWDDASGEIIKTCKEFPKYCPSEALLKNPNTISIWAEGVKGEVDLEIKEISATDCTDSELRFLD